MAPQRFLFVNKNARSATLSRAEADETMAVFRHVRKHLHQTKTEQTKPSVDNDGVLTLSQSTLRIINCTLPPSSRHLSIYPSSKSPTWKANAREKVKSWPVGIVAAESATSTQALSQIQRGQQQHGAIEPSLHHIDKATSRIVQSQRSEGYETAFQHRDGVPTFYRPICGIDESMDPFKCTSIPITKRVHQLLVYFESLWFPRTLRRPILSANFTSSGRQVMQDCISDVLQMNCVLACAGSRLENFYDHSIKGGSKQYVEQAIQTLRHRLSNDTKLDSKHIYAIMKLYIAESYRGNLAEALIHLNGARAAYDRLSSWTALDPHYTPTLCGMGEAYFLPKVWEMPATFPTIADPGHAKLCFSNDVMQEYLGRQDETAQLLLAYLTQASENRDCMGKLRQVVMDMVEYGTVRRTILSREHVGEAVPVDVVQWAHLRRFALVFRLMSINAVKSPLFHAIRVALVVWLAVVVDFTGFERNLEIVAMHLRDISRLISELEMKQNADVTAWILLLGCVVGDSSTRLYFVDALAKVSINDTAFEPGIAQWFSFLETISQSCLYCETIQKQSLVELAKELYSYRCQLLSGADYNVN